MHHDVTIPVNAFQQAKYLFLLAFMIFFSKVIHTTGTFNSGTFSLQRQGCKKKHHL